MSRKTLDTLIILGSLIAVSFILYMSYLHDKRIQAKNKIKLEYSLKKITENAPALSKSINLFEYRVDLMGNELDHTTIKKLLNNPSIMINRTSKGRERKIDIRPFLEDISINDGDLNITTNIIAGQTARVDEITRLLFGADAQDIKTLPILRRNQLIKE